MLLNNFFKYILYYYFRYIYGGKLSLETCETLDIIKILEAANELGLQELMTYLQTYLIESKMNWMEQNFNLIIKEALNQIKVSHN